jgi:hypothetical protein
VRQCWCRQCHQVRGGRTDQAANWTEEAPAGVGADRLDTGMVEQRAPRGVLSLTRNIYATAKVGANPRRTCQGSAA